MALDQQEIEQYWLQAAKTEGIGTSEAQKLAPYIVALAEQQSSGDPTAHNDPAQNGGKEDSRGLMQINVMAHPQYASWNLSDPLSNMQATAQLVKQDGLQPWALVPANASDPYGQATENPIVSAYQKGEAPVANATLTSDVTTTPTQTTANAINVGAQKDAPLVAGANISNFHGFDLSTIPSNQLGNAEQAILDYVANPNAVDANGLTLNQRLQKDFQYTTNFVQLLPANQRSQVMAVLIWAGQYLDNADASSVAQFDSAISQTQWYKTTSQYQRAWENLLGSDPETAQKELNVAQDKVLAVANQLGVQLSPAQLHQIANMYAAQSYEPTGTYSSLSGTSSEWLDQAVISAVTAVGKGGQPSDLEAQGPTASTPGSLTGISSALYQQFVAAAQQYLMYNPTNPQGGLLKDSDIMGWVSKALQSYTGTGASGQISQFEAGALNDFTQYLKDQASKIYPSMAQSIAAGTTPQQYVAPIQSVIQQTLGGAANTQAINFTDPQWSWTISTPDPKTGVKTALTPDQVRAKLVTMPIYDHSANAVMQAQQLSANMKSQFGFGG